MARPRMAGSGRRHVVGSAWRAERRALGSVDCPARTCCARRRFFAGGAPAAVDARAKRSGPRMTGSPLYARGPFRPRHAQRAGDRQGSSPRAPRGQLSAIRGRSQRRMRSRPTRFTTAAAATIETSARPAAAAEASIEQVEQRLAEQARPPAVRAAPGRSARSATAPPARQRATTRAAGRGRGTRPQPAPPRRAPAARRACRPASAARCPPGSAERRRPRPSTAPPAPAPRASQPPGGAQRSSAAAETSSRLRGRAGAERGLDAGARRRMAFETRRSLTRRHAGRVAVSRALTGEA